MVCRRDLRDQLDITSNAIYNPKLGRGSAGGRGLGTIPSR